MANDLELRSLDLRHHVTGAWMAAIISGGLSLIYGSIVGRRNLCAGHQCVDTHRRRHSRGDSRMVTATVANVTCGAIVD